MADATAVLSATPDVVRSLLAGLPDAWTTANEGGDTWSPFDIVGHLIHGERTDWIPRARMILEHGDSRAFAEFDRFAQFTSSAGRSLTDLLEDFASARRDSLRQLDGLQITAADLERHGRHPVFGPVTLRQLLATWVAHDLDHLAQVARVMARQYADEVGPWRQYLRVINGTPS